MLLALVWGLSIKQLCLYTILFAAAAAVVWVIVTKAFGWTPPAWFMNVFWIIIAAFVGIVAIGILFSMVQGA